MRSRIENIPTEKRGRGNPAWKKGGASPNPGGRSLEARDMVEAFKLSGPAFVAKIEELAGEGNIEALKLGMAYAYGKPNATLMLADPTGKPLSIGLDISKLSDDDARALRAIVAKVQT